MEEELNELKPMIRSILLALGKRTTEKQFCSEYFGTEGESFQKTLRKFQMPFYDFMRTMPDVCRCWHVGDEIFVERVSTKESTHMDNLTIVQKRKRPNASTRFRPNHGSNMILRSGSNFLPPTYRQARPYASSYVPIKTFQPSYPTRSYTAPKTFHDKKSTAPIQSRLKLSSLPPPPHLNMMKVVSEPPKNNSSTHRSAQACSKISLRLLPPPPHLNMMKVVSEPPKNNSSTHRSAQACSKISLRSLSPPPHFNDMKVMTCPKSDPATPNNVTQPVTQDLLNSSLNSSSWSSDDSHESEDFVFKQSRLSRVQPPSKIERPKDVLVGRCLSPFLSEVQQQVNGLKEDNKKKEGLEKHQPDAKADSSFNPFLTQRSQPVHVKKVDQKVKKYELDGSDKENDELIQKQPAPVGSTNSFKQDQKTTPNELRMFKSAVREIAQQKTNEIKSTSKIDNISSQRSWPIPHPGMREMKGVKFFEIELLEFISPSQFTFQFNVNELEHMMEEMKFHYNSIVDCNDLKINELVLGMTVAALKDDKWYRGEVVSVGDTDTIVYFVDYGCKESVKNANLRSLENCFAMPTRKACNGSLFGLKPKNGNQLWSTEAIMQFMFKTKGKKMFGTIKAQHEGTYELSLIEDVVKRLRIADFMVEQKLAEMIFELDYSKNYILI